LLTFGWEQEAAASGGGNSGSDGIADASPIMAMAVGVLIAVPLVRSFIPSAWTRAFMCARAACQARLWLRDIRGKFDMGDQPLTGQNCQLSRARISAKDTVFVSSKVCTGLRINIQSRSRHCSCTHAYNIHSKLPAQVRSVKVEAYNCGRRTLTAKVTNRMAS